MRDLSIIVISFNTVDVLQACLRSIYDRREGIDAEVFVVDNASSDGSPAMVAREFPEVKLILNKDNRGFAAANNQAMALSAGRHVLLLNSDTVVLGEVLRESVAYLDRNPDVAVMGCRVLNPDHSLQFSCTLAPSIVNICLLTSGLSRFSRPRWFGRYQMKHWDHGGERDVPVISGCYLMARREAIDRVGLLDDDFFFFGEETDWCARFRSAKWRVVYAPVGEIIHYGSVSAVRLGHKRDMLLTSGLVRYHRKHGTVVSAVLVWLILLAFNLSRCVYWAVACLVGPTEARLERRNHFLGVVFNYGKTWPSTFRRGRA